MKLKSTGQIRSAMAEVLKKTGSEAAKKDPSVAKARQRLQSLYEQLESRRFSLLDIIPASIALNNLNSAYIEFCINLSKKKK